MATLIGAAAVLLMFMTSPVAAAKGPRVARASEIDGPDAILARIREYLVRHGERGVIDPVTRLRRVAVEYERFRNESELRKRGLLPKAVGESEWVSIGPTNGAGRMTAVAPIPDSPDSIYAGAAGGGVWRTDDAGSTWRPLTDGLPDLSVGAIAVARSNPLVVYVGTGGGSVYRFDPGLLKPGR